MIHVDGEREATPRPIIVRYLWDSCHLVGCARAFVVEIPAERIAETLVDYHGPEPLWPLDDYLAMVASQSTTFPGTVMADHVMCLVTSDGAVAIAFESPIFPYSNLWNSYCPLRRIAVLVNTLADIPRIPEEAIQRAIDDKIASTWCLDPSAWIGTDLEEIVTTTQPDPWGSLRIGPIDAGS